MSTQYNFPQAPSPVSPEDFEVSET